MVAESVATKAPLIIEGLPQHIREVPQSLNDVADPLADAKRAEWQRWDRDVREYRVSRRQLVKNNPDLIPYEMARCANDPAYFLCMYGWIIEPRAESGSGVSPWVAFPIQIEMIRWLDDSMSRKDVKRDGVISKSRDMGATWTFCNWLTHGFLFKSPWSWLLMSRNQDLVESKSDDSLFTKIEFILENLPAWMLPDGFSITDKKFNSSLILKNPTNRAQIKGESTNSKAGRSGRYTGLGMDEGAFVANAPEVWAGLAATTDHRYVISSEHPDDVWFYQLGTANKNPAHLRPAFFAMEWYHRPDRNMEWFENERARAEANNELGKFYTEYLRDHDSDGSHLVYPATKDISPDPNVQFEHDGIMYASIDPGFNDECAIIWVQHQAPKYATLAYYQARGKEADFIGSLITGIPVIDVPNAEDHKHDWEDAGNGMWVCRHCHVMGQERFHYSYREKKLMAWTRTLPRDYLSNGNFCGDVSGKARHGATTLSMYDILRIKHGVFVNIDRTLAGEDVAFRPAARNIQNRIEFLRQFIPLLTFSEDNDAPRALAHLQASKFKEETGRTTGEPREPKHDESSHARTCYEYLASHLMLRTKLEAKGKQRAANRKRTNARDLTPDHPDYKAPFGRKPRDVATRTA